MYSYVVNELPGVIESEFPVDAARTGISAIPGRQGRVTIASESATYRSVSALPRLLPMRCPWERKRWPDISSRCASGGLHATALVESRGWKGPSFFWSIRARTTSSGEQLKPSC